VQLEKQRVEEANAGEEERQKKIDDNRVTYR
jgi:hypothetical protein